MSKTKPQLLLAVSGWTINAITTITHSQKSRYMEVHYTVLSTFVCLESSKIKGFLFKFMKKIDTVFSVR